MKDILSITNKAADRIKEILLEAPAGVDSVVVGVDKTGCSGYSYVLNFANSSEYKNYEFINEFGVKILVDPKATMYLIGSTMDFQTDKLSSRFTFNNPNEKSTCGCGESFSI